MLLVNRTAVIIIAKQPFLDWLHAVDPTSRQLKLDDLNVEPSIYLLPNSDSDEQAKKNLRRICKQIFAHELNGWWSEPSAWPQDLSYGVFVKWFDWRHHSMVFDVAEAPLRRKEA